MKIFCILVFIFLLQNDNSLSKSIPIDLEFNFENGDYGKLNANCLVQSKAKQEIQQINYLNVPKPAYSNYVLSISNGIGCLETDFLDLNEVLIKLEYYVTGGITSFEIVVKNVNGIVQTQSFDSLTKNKWDDVEMLLQRTDSSPLKLLFRFHADETVLISNIKLINWRSQMNVKGSLKEETTASVPTTTGTESTASVPTTTGTESTASVPTTTGTESTASVPTTTGTESTASVPTTTGTESTASVPTTTGTGSTASVPTTTGTGSTASVPTTTGTESTNKPTTGDGGSTNEQTTNDGGTTNEPTTNDGGSTNKPTTAKPNDSATITCITSLVMSLLYVAIYVR